MRNHPVIPVGIPKELNEQFTSLAHSKHDHTWVIEGAVQGYIATEQQFLDAVEEAMQDLRAGRVVPHDTVVQDLVSLLVADPDSGE